MKIPSIIAGIALLATTASLCRAETPCHATVESNIEISGTELTLADLLTRDSCAPLRTAAATVLLGAAPLEGIARILSGDEIRVRLQAVIPEADASVLVPERTIVRRAGRRASCGEIEAKLLPTASSSSTTDPTSAQRAKIDQEIDCGAGGRIPLDAPLQRTAKIWDPATRTWLLRARCVHSSDCVPFAVRVPANSFPENARSEAGPARPAAKPLVRAGQPAMLLWDEGGIRAVVPAICLDAGAAGETIRARMAHGTQVVHAIVVSARELKATS